MYYTNESIDSIIPVHVSRSPPKNKEECQALGLLGLLGKKCQAAPRVGKKWL
jgi:hypothetical protein